MTLREKLIVSRNKAGLSQMELAERLGVSRQAVSRWESGDTTPTMDKLKTLARIYGVSLDWLCSDAADRELPEAAKPEADRPPDDAPAGKEGEKKQKIRAIAIALAIVVIAFICVWFAARNMSNEADSTQIEDMEHEIIPILYILFIFLIPCVGWNPLLILWIIDLFISVQARSGRSRIIFYVLICLSSGVVVFNLVSRLFLRG